MKTGAIIYVAGEEPKEGFRIDTDKFLRRFGLKADRWEIITRDTGHFDVHDAWWRLLTCGMQRIMCLMAMADDDGNLKPTGRQVRLCG